MNHIMPSTLCFHSKRVVLRGANIIFVDSHFDNPNIDVNKIEELITIRPKAIELFNTQVLAAIWMRSWLSANKHNLYVMRMLTSYRESKYKGIALGSIGHLVVFSFMKQKILFQAKGVRY